MMDIRNVELSVEDILSIHRHWITKLYLDDHKSEMEIVEMLYERRLPVTYGTTSFSSKFTPNILPVSLKYKIVYQDGIWFLRPQHQGGVPQAAILQSSPHQRVIGKPSAHHHQPLQHLHTTPPPPRTSLSTAHVHFHLSQNSLHPRSPVSNPNH